MDKEVLSEYILFLENYIISITNICDCSCLRTDFIIDYLKFKKLTRPI